MTTIRKTVSWMMLLSFAGVVGGGAYVWQALHDYDRIIRDELENALREKVPEWDVEFADVRLDLSAAAARLSDVSLRPKGREGALVHVKQIVATLDRQLLTDSQLFRVHRVALIEPTVWVRRHAAGDWNWQYLAPPPRSDAPCPDVDIVRGTIVVRSERTAQLPETEFSCRSVNGRLVPSGHRRYVVRIKTDVDHAGSLAINGSIDLPSRAWQLNGDIIALDTQQGVLGVATGLSPELRDRVRELSEQEAIADWGPSTETSGLPRTVSASGGAPVRTAQAQVPQSEFSLPELGVRAELDVHFELGQAQSGAPFQYAVEATIHQGEIVNPALPVPLYNLRGRIRASHEEIVIEDVAAANGNSELFVSGRLGRLASGWSKDFTVRAEKLELSRRVRDYLHNDAWRRLYDQIQPAGIFDLDVHVAHDGDAPWRITLNEFTAIDCSLLHEAFQYPIDHITGSIQQTGYDFLVDLDGFAGDRPIDLRGQMRNPGPELEATFHITVNDAPLDRRVIEALKLPKYDRVCRALELLQLQGLANVRATLSRPGGPNQKFALQLHADVRDGTLDYKLFPYRITNLTGSIHFDPFDPALGRAWHFRDLKGIHEDSSGRRAPTTLTGEASYDLRAPPGQLDLVVSAENAPIDKDLHRACLTANGELTRIWKELSPEGQLGIKDLRVAWRPGSPVDVALPSVHLTNGRLKLRALPIQWHDVNVLFSWHRGTALIRSTLSAQHGPMRLDIIGSEHQPSALVEIEPRPNVAWHAHFNEIRLRGIVVDDELLHALPPGLAKVLAALNPQGQLDTDLSIDLKGAASSNETVTAQWSQRIHLNGNRLSAGIDLERAVGNIEIVRGDWDGATARVEGYVNLASARALNMPLEQVRGPFTIDGNLLVIGTPDHRQPKWNLAMPPMEHSDMNPFAGTQMRVDRFFADEKHRGRLGVNAVAVIDPADAEQSIYHAEATVGDASLRAWAVDRGFAPGKLRGSVNGHVEFRGQGSNGRRIRGQGYMSLSEAELFDLPVFASMMPMLNFKQSTGTLFNSGFADYTLHDGLVDFNAIDLAGDAFRLVGKGSAEFTSDSAGKLNLDFYSRADEQFLGIGRLPVFGAFFDNWIHVRVTGTMNDPHVRQGPATPVDFMNGFLEDIDGLRRRMMPFGMPSQRARTQGSRPRRP